MKKLILFIIVLLFFSCNERKSVKPKLDNFGNARIGMSIQEFDNNFANEKEIISPTDLKEGYAEFMYPNFRINDSIVLEKVYLNFLKNKLACISCKYQKDFFVFLKSKYGIKKDTNENEIEFETNSKEIYCGVEVRKKDSVIGIFKIGYSHY